MAIKINTWRPDTCGCVLHYSWDDSVPVEQRVHTPIEKNGYDEPTEKCEMHKNIGAVAALYDTVLTMNKQISVAAAEAAAAAAEAPAEALTDS